MEGQRERTSSRRRQRRKSKTARSKVVVEPVLIAARRPDSPRLENGFRNVVASAQPKTFITASPAPAAENGHARVNGIGAVHVGRNGHAADDDDDDTERLGAEPATSSAGADAPAASTGIRRRAVRIVKLTDNALTPGNREQQLLDRLVRSQGRGAISRAANDLWESKFVAPKRQEIQIQLLEHENETRARDAVFAMAELLQREAPIKRPVLDQRLRRLETSAEDPITRDAAGALRRSMRVHHGL
jgi:hypothetical protein